MRPQPIEHISGVLTEALDNGWTPLVTRTAGMTDDEYRWEPVPGCWTIRPNDGEWAADWSDPEPDPAPITTIAWRCWHIAVDCLDSYSSRVFGRTGTGLTDAAWVADWAQAADMLDRSWSVFRSGVAGWGESDLLAPLGRAWGPFANHSHADLALHALREVVHHGAEIALLRDLYRAQA